MEEGKRVRRYGNSVFFVYKNGTTLRFLQGVLDPLQQTVSDGCHLTRETGKDISEAGFSEVKRVLKPGGLYLFVEHVAAQDGTTLRFLQSVLDPLQ
ncbi:hypothetical protein HHK36_015746 [Tetracentron sinense]|uniref:Uncharacterized protein n=1 Tax=Tetracentron sinense TaxID=13715 RepID=A0A834Z9V4_TETSI|nr:hypothetical protein HHK36_015746 [Tetracentron sinense]